MENKNKSKPKIDIIGYGLVLGVGLGAALGSVIHDTTTGVGIGIIVGLLGAVIYKKIRPQK